MSWWTCKRDLDSTMLLLSFCASSLSPITTQLVTGDKVTLSIHVAHFLRSLVSLRKSLLGRQILVRFRHGRRQEFAAVTVNGCFDK
ncbi:uncharacterized protein LY79DRAFT_26692 [Colletotrichum navitas]|uniref:Secreted protein n=1 Tax=Colletotrichum navitas TaxID=681940 RepID=A0AAD8VAQ4_9PEZI|nr:uncharacterized protein LY79DRAFT_26692 [Colletotrichum navitas]KAK1600647.1 hypothetical protein LY79DRAFT_26692 [Colletotrichum navitas]